MSCVDVCMLCEKPQEFKVDFDDFHGCCSAHNIGPSTMLICINCLSVVPIIQFTKIPLLCSYCRVADKMPQSLECDHILCKSCYNNSICPICNTNLESRDLPKHDSIISSDASQSISTHELMKVDTVGSEENFELIDAEIKHQGYGEERCRDDSKDSIEISEKGSIGSVDERHEAEELDEGISKEACASELILAEFKVGSFKDKRLFQVSESKSAEVDNTTGFILKDLVLYLTFTVFVLILGGLKAVLSRLRRTAKAEKSNFDRLELD